jgi:hypothetical protein
MNTKIITRALGTLAITAAISLMAASSANAHFRGQVPEIDPAAVGSVVSVLLGGLAIFADRRRKR